MKVYVFLADGFEDVEGITVIDILRRASIEVYSISMNETNEVISAYDVHVFTDVVFNNEAIYDGILVLPGGVRGINNLKKSIDLLDLLITHNRQKKMIAAICAAPTILGSLGILKNKKVTCHPGFVKELVDAVHVDMPVIMEENIITGKNPAAAPYFALKLVELIKGEVVKDGIGKGMGYLS